MDRNRDRRATLAAIGAIALSILAGCAGDQRPAAFNAALTENAALAREHKISYTEGANRDLAAIERIYPGQMSDTDRVYYTYRVALAAEVDAGKVTPQEAKAFLDLRTVEYQAARNSQERAANAAALNSIGDSMRQAADAARPRQPVNCNSVANGASINTTCY